MPQTVAARRIPRPSRSAARHVGRHAHRVLVWLGGVAALLIVIAAAAIWRLLQGPVELDRLVPFVEQALQQSGAGIGVALAGVRIGIDRDTHQLDLQVQNVRLSLPNGEKLASFPQMATSFSLGALLAGRIEPTRLTVEHPVLALTRDENGALSFRVGSPDASPDQMALDGLLGMLAPPRPDTPWKQLRRITIRDATIVLDDRMSGRVWRADRAAATLERADSGVAGDVSFAVALGDASPELHATYRYVAATRKLDVELAADGVEPAAFAPLSPLLAPLAQARLPFSGTAGISFDLAAGRAEGGRLDLNFGAGRIATDLLTSGGLPVARGELHADYDPDRALLRLERLALDLGGGTMLTLDGTLSGLRPQLVSAGAALPARLPGTLGITLTHVPATRLTALWPRGLSPGGRKWVAANLSDGVLDELAMQVAVSLDPATWAADFAAPHGTMRFHDLTVDYLDGLPPVKKVSGSATLDDRRLDFAVAGGTLKSLKATGGSVSITDIGAPVETLAVDVALAGGLQDALEVIDAKRLGYAHDAGIDPARAGGKVETELQFKLPLLADVKFDQVEYAAKATLSGVSYSRIALDRSLSDGNFTLELGRAGVHVQGAGKFDGSPATIDGNLYFHPKSGPRSRYRIGLTLDDAARRRLDWDVGDRLSGPVAAELTYSVPSTGSKAELAAALDLTAAGMTIDEAGWKKPPQMPGSAKLVVALDGDRLAGLPSIEIRAPGLDARFAVVLNARDRGVERVDIRRMAVGDNDFAGTVIRRPDRGWRADIRAARLDASRMLKRALQDDGPPSPVPLTLDLHAARLILGPRREAQNVAGLLSREGGNWQSIRLDGSFATGRRFSFVLANRRLRFQSDDLGAAFALFGIADNVVGGRLTVDGTQGEADGHTTLRAHIEGSDYSLMQAPTLARLLSLASFEGVASMLSGSGIPFTTLRGDVGFSGGRIAITRLIAYGGALGITAKGWLNPGQDRIDIDGTLAPAYALNSVLSNFPVIGSLLAGGEAQGLFAASFRLTGSNDEPTVIVNPLSALTPGLLRHLFDPFFGASEAGSAAPDAAH